MSQPAERTTPTAADQPAAALTVGLRLRLEVDAESAAALDAQSRMHGWLHNQLVSVVEQTRPRLESDEEETAARARALLYSPYGLRNLLTGLKESNPFLRACWTYSLQCVAMRMTRTVKERGSRGPGAGWPTYHRWSSRWASLEYHVLTGGFTLDGRTLTLSFGRDESGAQQRVTVHLVERLPRYARPAHVERGDKEHPIRGLRVIREHGIYYAVFTVRRHPRARPAAPQRVIALDPHHYNLAIGVDLAGQALRIPYPPGIVGIDRQIDALKARRDHCQRHPQESPAGARYYTPSREWARFAGLIQEAQRRREARISQYLYELANMLCRDYDLIVLGDYAPTESAPTTALNRWTHNRSLVGRLRQTVQWVAQRSGKQCMIVAEQDTTRTCHDCGHVWAEGVPTDQRVYVCHDCGRQIRRNENNARNLLRAAHEQLNTDILPGPGHRVVPVTTRRTWHSAGLRGSSTPANAVSRN